MEISARTGDSLQNLLQHSMLTGIKDVLHINVEQLEDVKEKELQQDNIVHVALTVSGIDFKVILLLHYMEGGVEHYLSHDSVTQESGVENFFLEAGNRFCGEVKRFLYEIYDHLGMSTPYRLSNNTTIKDVRSELTIAEHHVAFKQDALIRVAGSIYLVSDHEIELHLDPSIFVEDNHAGELEFF